MSRKYDSTIAQIAGTITAGMINNDHTKAVKDDIAIAAESVALARLIVAEVIRTEPELAATRLRPDGTLEPMWRPTEEGS